MTRSTVIPFSEGVKAWRVWVPRGALSHVVHGNWFQARQAACVLLGCDIGHVCMVPYVE